MFQLLCNGNQSCHGILTISDPSNPSPNATYKIDLSFNI